MGQRIMDFEIWSQYKPGLLEHFVKITWKLKAEYFLELKGGCVIEKIYDNILNERIE